MNGRRMQRYYAGVLAVGMLGGAVGLGQAQASGQPSGQTTGQPSGTYQAKFPGDPARSDSEAQALGYTRVVLRAEREYKKRHDKYTASLEELAGTASFTKRMAHSTDRGDYTAGYRIHKDGFVFTMTPKQMDSEHRSFYSEEDYVIHADDQKAADLNSPKIK